MAKIRLHASGDFLDWYVLSALHTPNWAFGDYPYSHQICVANFVEWTYFEFGPYLYFSTREEAQEMAGFWLTRPDIVQDICPWCNQYRSPDPGYVFPNPFYPRMHLRRPGRLVNRPCLASSFSPEQVYPPQRP